MSRHNFNFEFDYDFELLAISSPVRDYRLCWLINRELSIELVRKDEHAVFNRKQQKDLLFNRYEYRDEINCVSYYFLENKITGYYLLPELKKADFLLLMQGDAAGLMKYDVMQMLNGLKEIQAVFEAAPASLRSKQNLIIE